MASRHYGEFEILDYSESKSSFSFNFGAITAVSLPGFLTNFGNLRTALGNIILGTISRERWIGDETILSNIPPLNSAAQREIAWLISYVSSDASPSVLKCTIGTADTSLSLAGSDSVDFSNPMVAEFVTAFETFVIDPREPLDETIIIDMKLIGRRN